jgi:uncharacterized protein YjiS (DUF1127 family)
MLHRGISGSSETPKLQARTIMAHIQTSTPASDFLPRIAAFFSSIGNGFVRFAENHARVRAAAELHAMSDMQLAKLGLKREDIIRHVFSDRYYL